MIEELEKTELEEIIAQYRLCAINHGRAIKEGDSVIANRNYDKLVKLLGQIREYGTEGDVALFSLTEDEDQSVRCWAATDSLKYDERRAKKVLKKLSKEKGIIAFDAKMVLNEWKKGHLHHM